jgi:hypothetical protein
MEKDTTTDVGLDDCKRKLVVAILRPGEREPEQREMPKEPHLIQRVFRRLTREGAVAVGPTAARRPSSPGGSPPAPPRSGS